MDYKSLIKTYYGWVFQKPIQKSWKPGRLYVLNYHNTPKDYLGNFNRQLSYLANYFEFIEPNDLESLGERKNPNKPWLLFTFDDGINSNLDILPILDEFNVKAIFFVVYDFIHAKDKLAYYRSNIRFDPHIDLEKTERDMLPMSIEDLKMLIKKGHSIGHHTASHDVRILDTWTSDRIRYELIKSKELLEKELMIQVKYFASPIDSQILESNDEVKTNIDNFYKKHFLTFGFFNDPDRKNIGRFNLEVHFDEKIINHQLSLKENNKWLKRLRKGSLQYDS